MSQRADADIVPTPLPGCSIFTIRPRSG